MHQAPLMVRRYGAEIVAGAAMLGLGLWGLNRGSMYSGEAATHWSATLSLHDLFHLLGHVDIVHGLYYLLIHFWFDAFGTGEATMRVPSVLGMTGAVVLVTIIGKRLSGSARLGLVAGLLTALVPYLDQYAQNGRSYGLVCLCAWTTSLALVRAVQKTDGRGWPKWLLYGGLLTLTSYLHEFAILLVVAHGATLLLARVRRPMFIRWLISAAAAGILVIPLAVASSKQEQAVSWIPPIRLHDADVVAYSFFGTSGVVVVLLIALAAIGTFPLVRRTPPGLTLTNFAVPLLVLPTTTLMIESAAAHPLFDPRYVLYSMPAGMLLAASGIEQVGGWLRAFSGRTAWLPAAGLGAAVCMIVFLAQLPTQRLLRTPEGRPQDYSAAAHFVRTTSRPGDGIVFITQNFRNLQLGYPQSFSNVRDLALRGTPKDTGTFRGTDLGIALIARAVLAHQRVFVAGRPFGLSADVRDRTVERLLEKDFVRVASESWTGISISMWKRRDTARDQAKR